MANTCGTYIFSSSKQEPEETYANKQQFQIAVMIQQSFLYYM